MHASSDTSLVAPASEDSVLDDPQQWAAFGKPLDQASDLWESNLVIEGMHCAACAITIESALRQVPGVQSVEVSAASHRARLRWSASRVKPSRWLHAVRAAGYRAVPANDVFARERRLHEARRALWRWLVAGLCMMQVMMYAYPAYVAAPGDLSAEMERLLRWASWVLTLPVILFSCGPFFRAAWRDVVNRQVSMDLPVALGMLITFVASTAGTFDPQGVFGREVYFDSLTMFVFFLLSGRWLELRLRDRTAGALEALLNRLPDSVLRVNADGTTTRVAVARLVAGDLVQVVAGETFPADGCIMQGQTQVDEALLSGEALPLARGLGSQVLAGSHNLTSVVQVRVEQTGQNTRFAQIAALMESAALSRPGVARLADAIAKPFVIAVLLAAAGAAAYGWQRDPAHALMVAVAVLIVTCPCALSLATPAAMLAAAGQLARRGVLVRSLPALEALAEVDEVIFDKTGTLTRDQMGLGAITVRPGVTAQQALAMASALARHSLHPVSRAIDVAARMHGVSECWVASAVTEVAGQGVAGLVSPVKGDAPARAFRLGSASFCGPAQGHDAAVQTSLADDQGWLASFELIEELRPDAVGLIKDLQARGIRVQILSGDSPAATQVVAARLGIDQARGGCSPDDKLEVMRAAQRAGRRVAVVGDGLNDGPALAGAHVSFALGHAVPLAQARADFVILGDGLRMVAQSLALAGRTMRVVRQNLAWAALYNAMCVPLAVLGWLPAWLAGLGMAASSLLVVLNALRLSGGASAVDNRPQQAIA
ncbi:heavy metal translocating P-type ATPase [Rhodoferax sp.]|uniref:heavy metal translocating P-type ATPase n=1 Tax=Rhodoferax sp. TaxID=50421 RepID=UPI0027775122|nr:cation-translocating P-type ATPase [Rhodoferax sp.]